RTSSRDSSSSLCIRGSGPRKSSGSSPRSRESRDPPKQASKGRNRQGHIGASMADAREAFARALHEGHEREHDQRWQDAVDTYRKLLATLHGKTGRLDLAFVTFTKAQDVLGAAEDWAGVAAAWEAQAQLRRAIHDEDRWREDLGEAIVFYDREGMKAKADRLRTLLGK